MFARISTRQTSLGHSLIKRSLHALKGKDIMSIDDFTPLQLSRIIDKAIEMKSIEKGKWNHTVYANKLKEEHLGMIFQKLSTRTRVSAEVGTRKLGGQALFLSSNDIQLGTNETIKDTAKVLSRFCTILMARVNKHKDIVELAKQSSIPCINALSDKFHPLQALADYMTLTEHFGKDHLGGKTIAWIGDGNNVAHDLMLAGAKLGLNINVATPVNYDADEDVIKRVKSIADENGIKLLFTNNPNRAVKDANIVVTDTWTSMGQEAEKKKRLHDFKGYQVTKSLMKLAADDAVFLHCLPRHSEEVTDEVFYSSSSLVFDEAENRMWTFMSLASTLLGK